MSSGFLHFTLVLWLSASVSIQAVSLKKHEITQYKNKVTEMFYHAYDNYLRFASSYDELKPISCGGMDTWGSFSLSLIDALDTLAVMGNFSEFRRVADYLISTIDFDSNINVSVFETNIRVVGGLLSAHLFSHKAGMELEPGWPCSGPLLRLAENAARRLLPAFDTPTGMPYGTVNLRHGVPVNETPVTCSAGVGTFIVEFSTLSQLTGDPIFQETALKAIEALHDRRSKIGLLGNHINVHDGQWTATEAGIGAGVDSFFEYLVKGAILLQMPQLIDMFYEYYEAINKYIKKEDWHVWVSMTSGTPTMPVFQSLEAFWPGVLTLIGEVDQAKKTLYNYHQVWKQYGFVPEFYDIPNAKVTSRREGYPLRPEFVESVLYLYKATRDPHLLQIGAEVVDSIYYSAKTECGYATIKNVDDHTIEDRMESFFLAETLKYLYLLFDHSNFIHNDGSKGTVIQSTAGECVIDAGGYVFNTEAHPIDIAAVYCCSSQKMIEDSVINHFQENLDLYSVLGFNNKRSYLLNFYGRKNAKVPSQSNGFRETNSKEPFEGTTPTKEVETVNYPNSSSGSQNSKIISDESLDEKSNEKLKQTSEIPSSIIEVETPEMSNTKQNLEDSELPVADNTHIEPSLQPTLESSLDIPPLEKTQDIFLNHADPIEEVQTTKYYLNLHDEEIVEETVTIHSSTTAVPENNLKAHSIDGWHVKSIEEGLPEEVLTVIRANPLAANRLTKDLVKVLISISDTNNTGEVDKRVSEDIDTAIDQTTSNSFESLLCPSQHFLSRWSLAGQMIDDPNGPND